jgi:nicotinamidase-related amidase
VSAIRDPLADHLLTPQNAALMVIDYQPSQIAAVRSRDPDLVLKNIVSTVKTAKSFGLPIVHSTINVASGRGKPTVPEPVSWVSLACELQRDWARQETVEAVVQIVLTDRLLNE